MRLLSSFPSIFLTIVCASGQHSIIYQKISVPSETFTNLNKTLATTEDGVKQCGYICSIQNAICNIFKYDIAGHICTFGKVFCKEGQDMANSLEMYLDPVVNRDCGGWGDWSSSGCGSDCKITRTRTCVSSSPASDGTECNEGVEELEPGEECKGGLCPGWGAWGPYGDCDSSCRKWRTRECYPEGAICSGSNTDSHSYYCNGDTCPDKACLESRTQLKEDFRYANYSTYIGPITNMCDDTDRISQGWYYFKWLKLPKMCSQCTNGYCSDVFCERPAFGAIPTSIPSQGERRRGGVCGTDASSWISGSIPSLGQAPVDAKVYFAWGSNDKAYELDTKIVSCHDDQYRVYPVYYLSPVPSCGALGFNILHCANRYTWA